MAKRRFIPSGQPNTRFTTHDGEEMVFDAQGSLRHAGGRIKGKAARKALKKARHGRG